MKKPDLKKRNNLIRTTLFWAVIMLFGLALFALYAPQKDMKEVAFSDVINRANKGEIEKIQIEGNNLLITPEAAPNDEPTERSRKEAGSSIYEQGLQQNS